tara:strand:+ start:1534 stop:1947 length:414 start_codon:yes stop_codon:yes gene_type:complete
MNRLWKNFKTAIKYSDTQLYELSLSLLMVILNPFHLLGLVSCQFIDSGMVFILILLSIVVGGSLFIGVLLQSLEQRYFVARLYWFFTLLSIVSILKCGIHEAGLLASFILQFVSSIFLVWRLGTEKLHRQIAQRLRE